VKDLIELLRDLCFLKRAPQDLPYAPVQLATLSVVVAALAILVARNLQGIAEPVPQVVVAMALTLGLPWIALRIARHQARFVQTAMALMGINIVFMLLQVPLILLMGKVPEDPNQWNGLQLGIGWLLILLFVWNLMVHGHILRHALDLPMRLGLLIAAVFFAIEIVALKTLFGQGVPAT
jgi:hypothetical protein